MDDSYSCDKCQKSFKSKYTLKSHLEKSKCKECKESKEDFLKTDEFTEIKEKYEKLQKDYDELKLISDKQADELSSREKDVRHIKEMYIKCLMEDLPRYKMAIYEKDRILRVYKELLRIALLSIFRMEEESDYSHSNHSNHSNSSRRDEDDEDEEEDEDDTHSQYSTHSPRNDDE